MARELSIEMASAVAASECRPAIFFEGEFASGTIYLWSGLGNLDWNGHTWQGVGALGKLEPIEEGGDVQARGIVVELSGIPPALIALALNEARQGKPGKIWFGFFDAQNRLIASPYLSFSGRLDVPEIALDGKSGTIRITYENRLIDLLRPRERRYTHEDQQIDYPGDLGMAFVETLQNADIVWGRGG